MIDTHITGIEEVVRKLVALGPEGERIASTEVVASALAVHKTAREILTNTGAVDTGRLRNSVTVAANDDDLNDASDRATGHEPGEKSGGKSGGKESPLRVHDGMLSAVIGTNVHYAAAVHFGTSGMAGRPFLFPAIEEERPKMLRRLQAALAKVGE